MIKLFNKFQSNKIFLNIFHLVSENVLRLLVGFFISIMIARSLGPENYGHFNYVISFCLIFSPFFSMGVDDLVIKSITDKSSSHEHIMGTSALVKFIGGLIGYITCIISLNFVSPEDNLAKWAIFIYSTFMLFKVLDVIYILYLANINVKKVTRIRNFAFIFTSLLKIYLLWKNMSWLWYVYISCIELLLTASLYIYQYIKDYSSIKSWSFTKKLSIQYFKECIPLFLISLFSMATIKIDQIMIGEFLGIKQLGIYAAAVKLIDLWQFIPISIVMSLFPGLIASRKVSHNKYKHNKFTLFSLMIWLGIIFASIVSLLGNVLVQSIFGEKYNATGPILVMYSWLVIIYFLSFARTKIFLAQGRVLDGTLLAFVHLILNFTMNYFFIRMHGILGAIYASALSYLGANLILSFFNKSIRVDNLDIIKSIYYPFFLIRKKSSF